MDRTKNLSIMVNILLRFNVLTIALTRMLSTIILRAMDRTKNLSIMVNILVRAMDRTKNLSIMVNIL